MKTLIVQKKIQCLEEKIAIFKEQKNWSGLAFKYYADTVKRTPKWNSKIRFRMVVSFNTTTKKINRAIVPFSWIFIQLIISLVNHEQKKFK